MMPKIEFLNPGGKLVDEVVAWLCAEGRLRVSEEGAASLAQLMVVVPTAQSGRNLRLALARRFEGRGVIPPRIVSPMQLVVPAESPFREATKTELAAVFQHFVAGQRAEILSPDGATVKKFRHLFTPDAFNDLTARFALLDQLADIWRVLAGGGMLMRDVLDERRNPEAEKFLKENLLDEESERWRELGELEAAFFEALHARGLCHPAENVRAASEKPAPIAAEIEEVVLPALADPIRVLAKVLSLQRPELKVTTLLHAAREDAAKFDAWGRPVRERWIGANRPDLDRLENSHIVSCATETALAAAVATTFPEVDEDKERPAVGLCDEKLFPELSAAFLNHGYELHNPERFRLSQSSLGRLVKALSALYQCGVEGLPWREFTAVLRSDDVMKALGCDDPARARILEGLDLAQNNFLPEFLPPEASFPDVPIEPSWKRGEFDAFIEAARKLLVWLDAAVHGDARAHGDRPLTGFLRRMLQTIFESRRLNVGGGEREFRAACEAMRELLAQLEAPAVAELGLGADETEALLAHELLAAEYSLEPDSRSSLRTEGWLELSWSAADHLCLAGFHEGAVPDSVIGHPFLPDALRGRLGLMTNEDRLARDTWLLKELLQSHAPGALRFYLARTSAAGDIRRPSRLLYLCADADLADRTKYLFGNLVEPARVRARRVAEGWQLRLPDVLPFPAALSPSAVDAYLHCPFTYLLQFGLKMREFREKEELEANDFGSLIHLALEEYARRMIARGDMQLTHAEDIRDFFAAEIFPLLHRRHALSRSLGLKLQLESVEGRLGIFADLQAQWAEAGWRIRAAEFKVEDVKPFAAEGINAAFRGTIDRIDQNIHTGRYRIVDYKTWDNLKSAEKHLYFKAKVDSPQLAFAETLKLPLVPNTFNKNGRPKDDAKRFASVQLPLYAECLAAADPKYAGAIDELCYLVLGSDREASGVYDGDLMANREIALATIRRALANLRENIFWPPGPSDDWKWHFRGLFVADPVKDLAESDWAARQSAKLESLKTEA